MGSFYTNITLRTDRHDDVVAAVEDLEREAFVSRPDKGCVVVYDSKCEDQDIAELKKLAGALSEKLKCAALAVLVHDDDLLVYSLHDNGKFVDEYNSSPEYFDSGPGQPPEGGDATALCRAFGVARTPGVEEVLHMPSGAGSGEGYIFESERHEALVAALGTPTIAVHTGYNYIEAGELPEGADDDTFTRV